MFDYATPSVRILTPDREVRYTQGTVLVVEDHPDSREILSLLFSGLGYTVLEADDEYKALPIIADTHLDLIVTDLGLPGMDGLEMVRRMRVKSTDSNTPKIALLTAYDRKDYLMPAREAGCDLVITKPIDLDKFQRLLNLLPTSESQYCVANSEPVHTAH